jgi:hypothetical protein
METKHDGEKTDVQTHVQQIIEVEDEGVIILVEME